jgi:hypothetical protein
MTRWRVLALACWLGFVPSSRAAESVLYAMTTSEPHAGTAISSETEILAVDPDTGNQRLVFSDAKASFFILTGATILAAGGRIFADGIDRKQLVGLKPVQFIGPETLYELSTDGSGQAHKVLDLGTGQQRVDFSSLFFKSLGSEFGYIGFPDGHPTLFVRDASTGKLLRKSELKGWNFGSPVSIGWMPDNQRIFFTEKFDGGPEASWTTPGSRAGTYLLDENATTAERLAPEAALHPKIAGMEPSTESPAFLIGTLPDGRLLFEDYERGPSGGGVCLYELDLASKTQEILPLHVEGDPAAFHLSASGERLAFAGAQKMPLGRPGSLLDFQVPIMSSLWVMELKSGQQRRLLSFPLHNDSRGVPRPSSLVNLIGWLDGKS